MELLLMGDPIMRAPFHVRIIQMDDANVLSPPIVFQA